jgi:cell division cycle 20-like protein 1 (cofactor of APC complex)
MKTDMVEVMLVPVDIDNVLFLKVLSASDSELQDDFYLNLIDWSSQNILSVGLEKCPYVWSACTSETTMLCDLTGSCNIVISVTWNEQVGNNTI